MTIKKQILSGLKWSALSKVASQLTSWVTTIYVIRLLVPGDYGLMAMAGVIIAFLSTFNEFGLGSALVQSRELEDERIGAVYATMLMMGGALSVLLALTAPWIAQFFNEPRLQAVISVAGLQFILSAATIVPESMLRREMTFKPLAFADLVGAVTASLCTLGLALGNHGVWALVLGNLGGALIRSAILISLNPRRVKPNLRLAGAAHLLSYGGYVTAARFVAYFMSQSDVLIGAKLLGKEALGLYTVSMHLASLPIDKAMSTVNQVAFSAIARMQDQRQAVRLGVLKAVRLLTYLTLPAILGLASVAPEFVYLVLGEHWQGAVLPLQLVASVIPLRMMNSLFFTAVNGVGRADIGFKNTVTGAVILPLSFFVGVQWGINGLAGAWLLGAPLVFLMNFRRTSGVIGFTGRELFAAIAIPLLASLTMVLAIFAIRNFGPTGQPSWPFLSVLIFSGAAIYCMVAGTLDAQLRREIGAQSWVQRIGSLGRLRK